MAQVTTQLLAFTGKRDFSTEVPTRNRTVANWECGLDGGTIFLYEISVSYFNYIGGEFDSAPGTTHAPVMMVISRRFFRFRAVPSRSR